MMIERELEEMPYDMAFETSNGNEELCHATGVEVSWNNGADWWNEYVDSDGVYYYGR